MTPITSMQKILIFVGDFCRLAKVVHYQN